MRLEGGDSVEENLELDIVEAAGWLGVQVEENLGVVVTLVEENLDVVVVALVGSDVEENLVHVEGVGL